MFKALCIAYLTTGQTSARVHLLKNFEHEDVSLSVKTSFQIGFGIPNMPNYDLVEGVYSNVKKKMIRSVLKKHRTYNFFRRQQFSFQVLGIWTL